MPIPADILAVERPKNTVVIAYGKDKSLYAVVASNQSITLQRVVAKQDGIDIYNKIESIGFGMQAPFYKYYVSIYPKLPSTVVRSRNWHVPIPEFK